MDTKSFLKELKMVGLSRETKTLDKATRNVAKVKRRFGYDSVFVENVLNIAGLKKEHSKKDIVGQSNDYDDIEAVINARLEVALNTFVEELQNAFEKKTN
jgi:hypothetical protein